MPKVIIYQLYLAQYVSKSNCLLFLSNAMAVGRYSADVGEKGASKKPEPIPGLFLWPWARPILWKTQPPITER